MNEDHNPKSTNVQDRRQHGVAIVLVALAIPVLFGFMAFSVDFGYRTVMHARVQAAADAAALAGAALRSHGGSAVDALAQATAAATANGYTQGLNDATVEVNIPPATPLEDGSGTTDRFVEVKITHRPPTFFAVVFGVQKMFVAAEAVAGPAEYPVCLLALDPAASASLKFASGNILHTDQCGIFVNSSSDAALTLAGGSVLRAGAIAVVGTASVCQQCAVSPTPQTGVQVMADPFAALTPPAPSTCKTYTDTKDPVTLTPGTYCGGISISKAGVKTFATGNYVLLGGGLSFSGNATVATGAGGVTFYNTGDASHNIAPITITALAGELTGPPEDTNMGILFWQDRLNTKEAKITAGSGKLTGNFYFPNNNMALSGGSEGSLVKGGFVALNMSFTGNSDGNLQFLNTYSSTAGVGLHR